VAVIGYDSGGGDTSISSANASVAGGGRAEEGIFGCGVSCWAGAEALRCATSTMDMTERKACAEDG